MGRTVLQTTYYDANAHGLPYDPLKAIVAPRPIGWISTYDSNGVSSLAPYSFFNLVSDRPKIVMFASVGWKDSASHASAREAFAANLVTVTDLDRMNQSSADLPRGRSEFEEFGIPEIRCKSVDAPRIADAVASLECAVTQVIEPTTLNGEPADAVLVFGQVVGYHIADHLMTNGQFNTALAEPVSRLGYRDYATVRDTFSVDRPGRSG